MRKQITKQDIPFVIVIFLLCSVFHYVEVFVLRTDESIFADNFINKSIGIVILAVSLKYLSYTWSDIGFKQQKLHFLFYGLLMGLLCFAVGYGIEFALLTRGGLSPSFEWYVNGFSLTGSAVKQTGVLAVSLCLFFNVVNVVMEEGIFRGLFPNVLGKKCGGLKAIWLSAFLFGLWHLSMPVKGLVDGELSLIEAIMLGFGYVFLAMIMGVKWGLWVRHTDCLWFGMAEHFYNNTIGNLLHVTSQTGDDEMQIVRILIAQVLSLFLSLLYFHSNKNEKGKRNLEKADTVN